MPFIQLSNFAICLFKPALLAQGPCIKRATHIRTLDLEAMVNSLFTVRARSFCVVSGMNVVTFELLAAATYRTFFTPQTNNGDGQQ